MKQELIFEAPRRALPPRHLADLDEAGRVEAVRRIAPSSWRISTTAA
jgi:23S rRNA (adenine2503-C2)-methyltransferase